MQASHVGAVPVLVTPLLIQLLANTLGKAMESDPNVWAPVASIGNPDEALGSWLQPDQVLAIAAIWGVY